MSNNDPVQTDDDFPGVNFALWGHGTTNSWQMVDLVFRFGAGDDEDSPGFENAVRAMEDWQ